MLIRDDSDGILMCFLVWQYVQMALLLYLLFSAPFAMLWWDYTESCLLWLGFDQVTADLGQEFAKVYTLALLVEGINETIHGLLDVIGLENYSTVIAISEAVLSFAAVLNASIFFSPNLMHVGMIHFGVGLLFLLINIVVITCRGWFKPYAPGLFGSFSLLNVKAVWLMCKTALALSFGFLLTDGEWEILTLLASFLGPAEVAAWSILGTLWVRTKCTR